LAHNGAIGVVVGIDLDYKQSKEATISMWRLKNSTNNDGEEAGEVVQVVDNQAKPPHPRDRSNNGDLQNQPFRDAQGNPVYSGLNLTLGDFVISKNKWTRSLKSLLWLMQKLCARF